MTFSLSLPQHVMDRAKREAARNGKSFSPWVKGLIEAEFKRLDE